MATRCTKVALHYAWKHCLRQSSFLPSSATRLKHCPYQHKVHQPRRTYFYSSISNTKPLFLHVIKQEYGDKIAIVDSLGSHSYKTLLRHSISLSPYIIAKAKAKDVSSQVTLDGERVAFLCPNNASYVITKWAIWMAGGLAVPLCASHPVSEIEYVVEDSQSCLLISTPGHEGKIQSIADKFSLPHLVVNEDALSVASQTQFSVSENDDDDIKSLPPILKSDDSDLLDLDLVEKRVLRDRWLQMKWRSRRAMLVYTSGTTGKPKGAVTTFEAYQAQVAMMLQSWRWTSSDVVLHTLPLHHVHGIVNLLGCPLWVGATVVMMPKFDAKQVWELLLSNEAPRINVFMAVPTIYAKLIQYYHNKYLSSDSQHKYVQVRAFIKALLKERIRLMVSGSAALPQPILEEWEEITGHRLLERYGMTEIGMALTNPLHGERVPGAVGNPFPSVQVRIVGKDGSVLVEGDTHGSEVKTDEAFVEGELQVKGPAVFQEYWNKPEATAETFTADGWFKTGDTAKFENDIYYIMGRTSVDIIKSGGYKISALEIERHLLSHEEIVECAVVGIPDVTWGQQVAAVLVLKPWSGLTSAKLREWARDKMAPYKVPTDLKMVEEIPKNAMGKVNKKQLVKELWGTGQGSPGQSSVSNARLERILSGAKTEF